MSSICPILLSILEHLTFPHPVVPLDHWADLSLPQMPKRPKLRPQSKTKSFYGNTSVMNPNNEIIVYGWQKILENITSGFGHHE